jgi:hypothetical protein
MGGEDFGAPLLPRRPSIAKNAARVADIHGPPRKPIITIPISLYRDEDGDDAKEGDGEPCPGDLASQLYLQKRTSSDPRIELLLILGDSDNTFEFYSGHIGKEFDRNE